ncbi:hypothetical protein SCMU_29080 [Sinomonas cyclohexanicum]|uniref:D-inositol 3-phosphate glycosyltransferase n=1 Tax=Sinomonas cyclohexanicum TaxID=322009 RepID=A0ABM7PXN9_SINCY|nr:hypothetical protein SCMU_29080 [Corynebacterium cyclohexanicum]
MRNLRNLASYVRPDRPAPVWFEMLSSDESVRDALRAADVVDLQWAEQAQLAAAIRRLNPRARIVCTVHDVLSQRFDRMHDAAPGPARRLRWKHARRTAVASERALVNAVDVVTVLSNKDAALLPVGRARIAVVTPPLAGDMAHRMERARGPELLLVSMLARWENEEGLFWFLKEVFPLIRAEVPGVRFRVAGLGIRPHVAEAAAKAGIELLGFVDDLEPLYDEAAAVVVPLRLGAGVKFKVVDALVRGVPVVTTPVGAEGIGTEAWFAGVHSDATEFAAAVVEVLTNPDPAELRAAAARAEAVGRFGQEQFEQSMREIYG